MFLALDTEIGRDVLIEPNVVRAGSQRRRGRGDPCLQPYRGAVIGPKAEVGPYARLRPGSRIGAKAKIGNFVEIKNTEMGPGAKASHLTYLGDAKIGAETNIGAGTITCNYDGFLKFETVIGANAFIGSNSALVAPVTIGMAPSWGPAR